ncbi:MAG TPA: hypothetical protein PKO36_06640 [Candidatus Hydrogenedentes bacterium]|nr:hypothetical protein [Candidatus Hydrogenedentota bacterium]
MTEWRNLFKLAVLIGQYLLYRMGRKKLPEVARYYEPGLAALDFLFGWSRRMRIVNGERCPKGGPVVFAGNHVCLDDPFAMGTAIFQLSQGGIRPHAMMRDDFFRGLPGWIKRIVDPDEVTRLIGALQISRQGAEPGQLKPFVDLLRQSHAFLIYPGRSRSRSGLFVEYRDWINSPGATSFFLAQAQEGYPEARVAAVPVARTFNPVKKTCALVFGAPLFLPPGADRAAQREFDYRLVVAMSDLVEVNVAQILAAYVYLHSLHGFSDEMETEVLKECLRAIFGRITRRYVDPAAYADLENEIRRTLRFLARHGVVRLRAGRVHLNREAILSVPRTIGDYRKRNPVKYLANQILHMSDVVRAVEQEVCR